MVVIMRRIHIYVLRICAAAMVTLLLAILSWDLQLLLTQRSLLTFATIFFPTLVIGIFVGKKRRSVLYTALNYCTFALIIYVMLMLFAVPF
jgi:hypothetical protein